MGNGQVFMDNGLGGRGDGSGHRGARMGNRFRDAS